MSLPVISLATEAALAHAYPQTLNRRERKIAEAVKAYVDGQITVKPAFVVVAAASIATVAGATQTISVSGALSTDIAICVLKTVGATPRTVLTTASASGHITVVMSGDPSTDHVLSYELLRANM